MKSLYKLIATCLILVPLSSCAMGTGYPIQAKTVDQAYYFIDEKGIPRAIDSEGNKIMMENVKFPLEGTKKILNVQQLTIIEIEGSHFVLVCSRGGCRKRYLPHR